MALLKLCKCGKQIPMQQECCNQCQHSRKENNSLYDKYRRNKERKAFYQSKEWKRLAEVVYYKQNGLCQNCLKNKKITQGTVDKHGKFKRNIIDHIIPISVDWSKRLLESNLQVLCISCHNRKTAKDKSKI